MTADRTQVGRFQRLELSCHLRAQFENPYDPEQIDVVAVMTTPDGEAMTVPAFFFQPYERHMRSGAEVLVAEGKPHWRVRVSPFAVGRWSYRFVVRTARGTDMSDSYTVQCVPSDHPGFVRVQGDEKYGRSSWWSKHAWPWKPRMTRQYFTYDNGECYYPIGENLAWYDPVAKTFSYDKWCARLQECGANFFRLWMAPWAMAIEWDHTGLGQYDQERSWQMDYIFQLAETKGFQVMLSFLDHGQFSFEQDPEWPNNPYNAANGGPCEQPTDFLTHPEARQHFKHRLRYMAARWGYSTSLFAWEWFNEADLSDMDMDYLKDWIVEMDDYLDTVDPYDHMRTTSFHKIAPEGVGREDIWNLPGIAFTQLHIYEQRDYSKSLGPERVQRMLSAHNKPFLVGEFGWIDAFIRKIDRDGLHFHNGLWSSTMSGAAGTPMIWYWDEYIESNDLYWQYQAFEAFVRDVNWCEGTWHPVQLTKDDPRLLVRGQRGPSTTLVWLRNVDNNLDLFIASLAARAKNLVRQELGQSTEPVQFPPSVVREAVIELADMDNGHYTIEWWDPYRGTHLMSLQQDVANGVLALDVPDVNSDIACKIIKKLTWWEQLLGGDR